MASHSSNQTASKLLHSSGVPHTARRASRKLCLEGESQFRPLDNRGVVYWGEDIRGDPYMYDDPHGVFVERTFYEDTSGLAGYQPAVLIGSEMERHLETGSGTVEYYRIPNAFSLWEDTHVHYYWLEVQMPRMFEFTYPLSSDTIETGCSICTWMYQGFNGWDADALQELMQSPGEALKISKDQAMDRWVGHWRCAMAHVAVELNEKDCDGEHERLYLPSFCYALYRHATAFKEKLAAARLKDLRAFNKMFGVPYHGTLSYYFGQAPGTMRFRRFYNSAYLLSHRPLMCPHVTYANHALHSETCSLGDYGDWEEARRLVDPDDRSVRRPIEHAFYECPHLAVEHYPPEWSDPAFVEPYMVGDGWVKQLTVADQYTVVWMRLLLEENDPGGLKIELRHLMQMAIAMYTKHWEEYQRSIEDANNVEVFDEPVTDDYVLLNQMGGLCVLDTDYPQYETGKKRWTKVEHPSSSDEEVDESDVHDIRQLVREAEVEMATSSNADQPPALQPQGPQVNYDLGLLELCSSIIMCVWAFTKTIGKAFAKRPAEMLVIAMAAWAQYSGWYPSEVFSKVPEERDEIPIKEIIEGVVEAIAARNPPPVPPNVPAVPVREVVDEVVTALKNQTPPMKDVIEEVFNTLESNSKVGLNGIVSGVTDALSDPANENIWLGLKIGCGVVAFLVVMRYGPRMCSGIVNSTPRRRWLRGNQRARAWVSKRFGNTGEKTFAMLLMKDYLDLCSKKVEIQECCPRCWEVALFVIYGDDPPMTRKMKHAYLFKSPPQMPHVFFPNPHVCPLDSVQYAPPTLAIDYMVLLTKGRQFDPSTIEARGGGRVMEKRSVFVKDDNAVAGSVSSSSNERKNSQPFAGGYNSGDEGGSGATMGLVVASSSAGAVNLGSIRPGEICTIPSIDDRMRAAKMFLAKKIRSQVEDNMETLLDSLQDPRGGTTVDDLMRHFLPSLMFILNATRPSTRPDREGFTAEQIEALDAHARSIYRRYAPKGHVESIRKITEEEYYDRLEAAVHQEYQLRRAQETVFHKLAQQVTPVEEISGDGSVIEAVIADDTHHMVLKSSSDAQRILQELIQRNEADAAWKIAQEQAQRDMMQRIEAQQEVLMRILDKDKKVSFKDDLAGTQLERMVKPEGPVPYSNPLGVDNTVLLRLYGKGYTTFLNGFVTPGTPIKGLKTDTLFVCTGRHRFDDNNEIADATLVVGDKMHMYRYGQRDAKLFEECEVLRVQTTGGDEVWYTVRNPYKGVDQIQKVKLYPTFDEAVEVISWIEKANGSATVTLAAGHIDGEKVVWETLSGPLAGYQNPNLITYNVSTKGGFCRAPVFLQNGKILAGHWYGGEGGTPPGGSFIRTPQSYPAVPHIAFTKQWYQMSSVGTGKPQSKERYFSQPSAKQWVDPVVHLGKDGKGYTTDRKVWPYRTDFGNMRGIKLDHKIMHPSTEMGHREVMRFGTPPGPDGSRYDSDLIQRVVQMFDLSIVHVAPPKLGADRVHKIVTMLGTMDKVAGVDGNQREYLLTKDPTGMNNFDLAVQYETSLICKMLATVVDGVEPDNETAITILKCQVYAVSQKTDGYTEKKMNIGRTVQAPAFELKVIWLYYFMEIAELWNSRMAVGEAAWVFSGHDMDRPVSEARKSIYQKALAAAADDESAFDRHVPAWLLYRYFLYMAFLAPWVPIQILCLLAYVTIHSRLRMDDGEMYLKATGLPSGFMNTIWSNCFCKLYVIISVLLDISQCKGYIELSDDADFLQLYRWISKNFHIEVCGDDGRIWALTAEAVDVLGPNMSNYLEYMKEWPWNVKLEGYVRFDMCVPFEERIIEAPPMVARKLIPLRFGTEWYLFEPLYNISRCLRTLMHDKNRTMAEEEELRISAGSSVCLMWHAYKSGVVYSPSMKAFDELIVKTTPTVERVMSMRVAFLAMSTLPYVRPLNKGACRVYQ